MTVSEPLIFAEGITVEVTLPDGSPLRPVVDASAVVMEGSSAAVVGRSGSGKTSLISVLGLLSTNFSGTYRFKGQDPRALSDRQLAAMRAKQVGFVFQNFSLMAHLNAVANVAVAARYAGYNRVDAVKRARRSLSLVGLHDRGESLPAQLSGGEQQRVAIARALVTSPCVVVADEPTGALDVDTGDDVFSLLLDGVRNVGTTLLVVTHDRARARCCDRILEMDRGRLSEWSA
jgi:putative ABC transport system ATP-binding protein